MTVEVERLLVRLEANIAQYNANMASAQRTTNSQLAAIERRFAATSAAIRSSSSSMALSVTGALGSIGGTLATAAILEYANAWTRVSRSVEASSQVFGIALRPASELNALANDARVDLEAYAKLYIRTSAAIRDYGFEAGTAEKVTSTLAKALKLGGASASEQASVLLQFSQALQKGKLDGDEFRSVMENAGVVQELLAKRLGVTKGEIIKLAADGKLRINDLVSAMVDGATQVDALYRKMPQTIDEAFSVLNNNLTEYIGELDKATGASQALAGGIITLSNNLDVLAVIAGTAIAVVTRGLAGMAIATLAAIGPATALAAAIGALATASIVYQDEISVSNDSTVKLRDSVAAFLEVVGHDAAVAFNSWSGYLNTFVSENEKAIKAFQQQAQDMQITLAQVVAQVVLFQDQLAKSIPGGMTGSWLDSLKAAGAYLDRVDQLAGINSAQRGIEERDFGALIRKNNEDKLFNAPTKQAQTQEGGEARTGYERARDDIKKRIELLREEASLINAGAAAQERARIATELRAQAAETARREGRAVTEEEIAEINRLADAYGSASGSLAFLNSLKAANDGKRAILDEIELMGLYGAALEEARIKQQLLNAAREAGTTITPQIEAQINATARETAQVIALRDALQEMGDTSKDVVKGFIADLREGASATEALGNALNRLADKLIDMAVNGLVDAALGGLIQGSGGASGLLSGGGGLASLFADGGVAQFGRPRQLPKFARGGISKTAAIFGETGRPEAAVPLPDGRRIPVELRGAPSAQGGAMAPSINFAPVFNVENGTAEGIDKLKTDIVPELRRIVQTEVGQLFDRSPRFAKARI